MSRSVDTSVSGVGVLDVVPNGLSTVYFYWDPLLRDLSLGVYSALHEIALCQQWGKRYYYLGYLVAGSKTMSYKASFTGGEVWGGDAWTPAPSRDVDDVEMVTTLAKAEVARLTDLRRGQSPDDLLGAWLDQDITQAEQRRTWYRARLAAIA